MVKASWFWMFLLSHLCMATYLPMVKIDPDFPPLISHFPFFSHPTLLSFPAPLLHFETLTPMVAAAAATPLHRAFGVANRREC
ncbi:hypothetical protein L1887_07672 [Cichorium endivia]|nr:hypothetical protein L1887_07672 [Cichorium endivia]